MAVQWYLPGSLFLAFMIVCLLLLLLVYWKAQVFLRHRSGGYEGDEGVLEEEDEGVLEEEDTKEDKDPEEAEAPLVAPINLKSLASVEETTSLLEEDLDEEVELIKNCTFGICLLFSRDTGYLSGYVENIQGIDDFNSRRINSFRFHLTFLPSKKRAKTRYCTLKELSVDMLSFCFNSIKIEDIAIGTLRLRLYGRRLEYRVPISNEKCLGESYMGLKKHMSSFEKFEKVTSRQAILPKSTQFPSTDYELF